MTTIIFDIEADGLTPTQVWCISTKDLETGVVKTFDYYHIEDGINLLLRADLLIGHNILSYDLPVLERLHGLGVSVSNTFDTMIMSRLLRCDRTHPHSLEAWGEQLGVKKVPDLDWSEYSEGMLERCEVDVKITELVYKRLLMEMGGYDWTTSKELEHNTAYWHAIQEANGVGFDKESAVA